MAIRNSYVHYDKKLGAIKAIDYDLFLKDLFAEDVGDFGKNKKKI